MSDVAFCQITLVLAGVASRSNVSGFGMGSL